MAVAVVAAVGVPEVRAAQPSTTAATWGSATVALSLEVAEAAAVGARKSLPEAGLAEGVVAVEPPVVLGAQRVQERVQRVAMVAQVQPVEIQLVVQVAMGAVLVAQVVA